MAAKGLCDGVSDSLVHQHDQGRSAGLEHAPDRPWNFRSIPDRSTLAITAPRPPPTTTPKPVPKPKPASIPRNIPQMIPTTNLYGLVATQMLPSQLRMMALAVSGDRAVG